MDHLTQLDPIDPFYKYPRIPVTPSTLFAYAHMRGPKVKQADPLHDALYPAMSRVLHHRRLVLPLILKSAPMEGLAKGTQYFWDPLTVAADCLPSAELSKPNDSGYSSSGPHDDSRSNFLQFKLQNPPKASRNHYQGKDVWSNFGYLRINDKWVDPESQEQLYNAYYNPSGCQNSETDLSWLNEFEVQAPKVLTAEEEDEFYKGYVSDVDDSQDGEGDPRHFRISAATFARWAAGAVKGDKYESKISKPSEGLPAQTFEDALKAMPSKIMPMVQVDHDTGSIMSGEYSVESSPALIQSSHGFVDLVRQPAYFQRSYAQTALDLDEHAFATRSDSLKSKSLSTSTSSTASDEEVFTNDGVFTYLETKHGGEPVTEEQLEQEYVELEHRMANLRYKKDMIIYRNLQIYEASKRAFEERLAVSQEVAHLRKRLEAAQAEQELMQAMYWGPEYARAYAIKQQEEHNDRQQKEMARQHLAQYTLAQQTDYFRYLQAYQTEALCHQLHSGANAALVRTLNR